MSCVEYVSARSDKIHESLDMELYRKTCLMRRYGPTGAISSFNVQPGLRLPGKTASIETLTALCTNIIRVAKPCSIQVRFVTS